MKQYFFGLLTGLVITALVGVMLFDNWQTKLVVSNLNNTVGQIVQVLNKAQQPQAAQPVK